MARFAVWAVILLGLGLFMWGLLNEAGTGGGDISDAIADRTKEALRLGDSPAIGSRNVTVRGSFQPTSLELKDVPTGSIVVEYTPQNKGSNELTVNGVRVHSEGKVRVVLDQYRGIIRFDGRKLLLDGKSTEVRVNDVLLTTESVLADVKLTGVSVEFMEARSADISRFAVQSLQGTLRLQDDVEVRLKSEPLEMDSFLGTIELKDRLELQGKARRVFIAGEDHRTVVT